MGIQQEHAFGRQQKFYVNEEAAVGTFAKPATGDSMRILKAQLSHKPDRKDEVTSYMSSRDVTSSIQGRTELTWSVDAEYIPSGTKNVAPDCGAFIKNLLGVETVNANDVTYSQNSSQTLTTLSLVHQLPWLQKCMWGCVVDEMTLSFKGGETPKISFSGKAMGYAQAGYAKNNTAMVATATLPLAATYYRALMPGSVVQVGNDTNAGAGFQVTANNYAGVVTLEAVATADDESDVIPYMPTWAPVGSPMTGLSGTLTWDSASLVGPCSEFTLSCKSGNTYQEDGAFEEFMTDAITGIRDITGTIAMKVRKDLLLKILDREAYTAKAIAMVSGGAAQSGTRLEVSMPYCRQIHADFDIPETAEVTISMPFKAHGSAGNDAITMKHT